MFGISFLAPLFLIGLAAGIVPLVIHFFIRKKIETIPFSFIQFLVSAGHKKLQSFKLSKIMLLLLRILILSVLALALAKPFFRRYAGVFFTAGESSSIVILLDNSYSISMIDTNVSRWDRAKDAVYEITNLISDSDEIALVSFSYSSSFEHHNFTKDKFHILNELDKLEVSPFRTKFESGLKEADRLLRKARNNNKKIILITDMQKNGWDNISHGVISSDIKVHIINIGQKNTSNLAVTNLDFPNKAIKGQIIRFSAMIKNYGNEKVTNKLLGLVINGQNVSSQNIDLEPNEGKNVNLYYTFNTPGIYNGYVEINDAFMPVDNKNFFSLEVIDKIKILSVSTSSKNDYEKNEAFYLNIALNPSGSEDSIFRISSIDEDNLAKIEFSDFDLFILSNVPALSGVQVKILEECIKRGSGILFFLGDKVIPEKYNEEIYKNNSGILPGKITYQIASTENSQHYYYINKIDNTHAVFSVFQEESINQLQKVPFYSFYRTEVNELSKGIKILAWFNDGLPALIEKEYEKGHVLLFTSSIGLKWNILAINSIFPSLIHQCVRYLSLYKNNDKINFKIGEDDIPIEITNISPGIHKIKKDGKEKIYVLNLDFKESNLEMISEEEVVNKIITGNVQLSFTLPSKSFSGSSIYGGWFKGEIWKVLFIVLLFLLVIETLLANRYKEE